MSYEKRWHIFVFQDWIPPGVIVQLNDIIMPHKTEDFYM
jgi:hypothetical protein